MSTIQELENRLERAKEVFAEQKEAISTAEKRTVAKIDRNTQPTKDALFVLKNALEDNIKDRKTTMTQMTNYLRYVNNIIENLEANGIHMNWIDK